MKYIFKILFTLLILSACNQTHPTNSTTSASSNDSMPVLDTEVAKVDTTSVRIDSASAKDSNKKQDAQFHKPTVDEIADTRFRHNSPLRVDKRPLTQAEIEEDEFYEEYIRLRDIKRKERARKRAQQLLNSDSQ